MAEKYIDADLLRKEIESYRKECENSYGEPGDNNFPLGKVTACDDFIDIIASLQQEQPGVDLEKFTEKMNDWKARFNRPDDIPIKATMAFTARMFYMYPKAAREWYESLPKATMDYARKEENK